MQGKRGRPKKSAVPSKLCLKCDEVKPMSSFYKNRDWMAQQCTDAWCKSCAQEYCKDKETLREYCWHNNRQWSDHLYDTAVGKSKYYLSKHNVYLNPKTPEKTKEEIRAVAVVINFFAIMNLAAYYRYIENIKEDGEGYRLPDDNPVPPDDEDTEKKRLDFGRKRYYPEWHGEFTDNEIQYLRDYYEKLQNDFSLDTISVQDYARKIALASLTVNIKSNDLHNGRKCSTQDLKDAINIFDSLSKSAKFAESSRKAGESTGLGNLGEIIARIENTGLLQTTKVEFEKDDIDLIIDDFRHTIAAVGLGVSD